MGSISNLSSGFKKLTEDLRISYIFNNNYSKNNQLLNWVLFFLILYGLSLKFQLSLSHKLDSDDVSPGLVWKEFFVHGNSFLQGFYFPFADPHVFSDLIPYHLLPQLLSGYDPVALALSAYFIFVAIILIFSVLIYNMTKNITNSLIFASLFVNIPNFAADNFFLRPEVHMGAITFLGILLLIYPQNSHGKLRAVLYLLILALISFSDSLILLWYFVPFFVASTLFVLLNRPFEIRKLSFPIISGILVSLVYLVKGNMPTLIKYPISLLTDKCLIFENFLLLFKGICLLYNHKLFEFANTSKLNILAVIVVLITIGIMYFVFSNISRTFRKNPVWCLFVIFSITIISIAYVFTSISINIYTTRYLTFPLMLGLSIVALTYNQNMKLQKVYLFLILSIIFINAGSNAALLKGGYEQPNKEQYELIEYLKDSNLTLGYGDYWDANLITYLSSEEIVIMPVIFNDAKITPYKWLSFKKWFTEQPGDNEEIFVIQSHFQNEEIEYLVNKIPPQKILKFGNYNIYVWDSPELKKVMEDFDWK